MPTEREYIDYSEEELGKEEAPDAGANGAASYLLEGKRVASTPTSQPVERRSKSTGIQFGSIESRQNYVPDACDKVISAINNVLALLRPCPCGSMDRESCTMGLNIVKTYICSLRDACLRSTYPDSLQENLIMILKNCDKDIFELQDIIEKSSAYKIVPGKVSSILDSRLATIRYHMLNLENTLDESTM
jgi:hypothetical protein